jgi:hypothetical protein
VAKLETSGTALAEAPLSELQAACGKIGRDVYRHLGAANVVKHYAPDGAAGSRQLAQQLAFWKRKLG